MGEWRYGSTTVSLNARRWVISFTPRPLYNHTHWIGDWLGPIAGLDIVERKYLAFAENRTPSPQSSNPWARHYTDWAIPAPKPSECHCSKHELAITGACVGEYTSGSGWLRDRSVSAVPIYNPFFWSYTNTLSFLPSLKFGYSTLQYWEGT
jgi:hypothetical protein